MAEYIEDTDRFEKSLSEKYPETKNILKDIKYGFKSGCGHVLILQNIHPDIRIVIEQFLQEYNN